METINFKELANYLQTAQIIDRFNNGTLTLYIDDYTKNERLVIEIRQKFVTVFRITQYDPIKKIWTKEVETSYKKLNGKGKKSFLQAVNAKITTATNYDDIDKYFPNRNKSYYFIKLI